MKKVNLAKALLKNKNCWGFIIKLSDNNYEYQNDNDLGLDLEAIDIETEYVEKVYISGRYYAYLLNQEDGNTWQGVDLEMAKLLLKECHSHITPLTNVEKEKCDKYWKQF